MDRLVIFAVLLFFVGGILCWVGFKILAVLVRIADSIQILVKDHREAVECHAVGTIAATLIAGTLSNPKYSEHLDTLREKQSECSSALMRCAASGECREQDGGVVKTLEELRDDYKQVLENADVFMWAGRKKFIELAISTYSNAKSLKSEK